ncbi:transcriptional activator DEMETER [Daucus carota subsp. sativus]|uniref:transcriptional activator DEMETER n=1 Tax=Daucus carota subsp. sativus TaxID=79200 RepID=UPI0007EFCD21|nr:PREDICTED: transcriptional activator DEMETER-like [Daucus carota subsp. sativus]
MNYGRGSPIAQKNDIVQNGDSWFSLTPPGKLILPRSAPVPVDMPGNQRIGTWQDLLGMYSEILNHDVAIQTPNPSSVTSINRRDFDLFDVVTAADQHLNRNADAYVQNFSNDSAGSCNNRAAEVIGIRTKENYVLSSGQRNNGQISIRHVESNARTQVAGNWRELESTNLMLDRQHSLRCTDSNVSTQVASNWTELEATSLMLDRQHSISGSNQRLNTLSTQMGSNTQVRSNCMQHEATMFGKQKYPMGSNQRLLLQMHNNGYHEAYQTNYNQNSPPRPGIANAELSVASSFPFAPVTPDQRKQLDHQTPSTRLNVSIDECSSQEKDKQWHAVSSSSGENENTTNEFSQVIVDAASAAISTPLKEANILNEIEEHGLDLNKTPDQKTPKKRKHRPKVVREGKPKKVPKSAPPKTEVSNGTPSGKRKYVRKKNIKTVESQKDVVNEVRSSAFEPISKSCRRALNFDLESSTGDASQKMLDSHQVGRYQENKKPFNLNVDAEDKETCTVIDSMSRTSSFQMEQSRQQKELIEKNQQTASTFGLFHSNGQMPSQLRPLAEQRKDHNFARNLNMRNAAPGQSGLKNGYIQVPEQSQREEISQDAFQADVYRQPSTQLVMTDMASWNENRGCKRSHCYTVQEMHPHNQNLMIPPFLSLGNSGLKNINGNTSNIGTVTSGTQKRLNTSNGLHVNISSMQSPTNSSLYRPGQVERDQVRMYVNSGSSEINCRSLNSGFESDKSFKKLDGLVNGTPRTPVTGQQIYQKQQASIPLHAPGARTTEHVYQYNVSTSDSQQAIVGYNPHMSTSKQILKPSPLKQGSGRAEKMLLQEHNQAKKAYKPTPQKARSKPRKPKMSNLIEEITLRLESLLINIKINEEVEQEQHALVPYNGSSTIVPYEQYDIKKRKPRPKVDLDPETDRIWKLLMGIEGSESAEATDKDKEKWWEGEREVFRGRADSFIARMHLVQGDRRFSRWKGSVVDSVIGVFLTQNVSDHLSSSAFMSLVARFPLQSDGFAEEPDIQVLESGGSIKCHEEIEKQPILNLPSYIPSDYFDNLPSYKANVASDFNRKSDAEINLSRNYYESFNFQASREEIISNPRSHSMAGFQECGYNSVVNSSPLKTVLQTEVTSQNGINNHSNSSSGCSTQRHEQSEDPILGRHGYLNGPAIYPCQTNSHILRGPAFSSRDIQLNLTPKSIANDSRKFGLPGDETLPCFPTTHTINTKTDGANLLERYTRDTVEGKSPELQIGGPSVQANRSSFGFSGIQPTQISSVQQEDCPHSNTHELGNFKNLHSELTPAANNTIEINGQQTQKISDNTFGSNTNMENNSSVIPLSGTSTNVSRARKGKGEAGTKIKIDWDYLRKDAQLNGKRERSKDTMDSLDYEAMRRANVNEISDAIRERGMNNMLAERIKDFLDRLVNDHGSIDLEWLRDVPGDKAKDYLLSVRGLGLKSVECVRLLTLHQLAFPVDTNVGRIAVRLGWVPLQPLPESLQLHLLELYPILESIQKYLWPRLCKLDQQTLYELHYQMITFGKVFCTKSKPNCNACPMRGECRHFASAFASARLALPGPEEKGLVNFDVPVTTDSTGRDPLAAIKPVQLLEGVQDQSNDAGLLTKKYEPIVEEPSTPEQEVIELVESDIEDAFGEDPDEIPTIKLNLEEFTLNLQNYMQDNMELQDGDMSRALVALNPEAASIPTPKLKNVSRLRTEHQVYELPDSHPLLEGLDPREPDDPSPYLLAIWTPGETADSVQPPERRCETHESGQLCNDDTCFSCNSTREANSKIVRGTLLIPCRTAMRGSFPLNGTYFQVNEMFADHESSLNPIAVPRSLIWNLTRRTVYFGTSVTSIFKGLPTEDIQYCFWRGFVCVRGFDHKQRAPRPLMARLHFPASKLAKAKK